MKKQEPEWTAKSGNKKELTIEDAKFSFDQSEKFLIQIIDAHNAIIERTNSLLVINLTILIAIIGFNVGKIEGGFGNDVLSSSLWVLITYLLVGVIYLVKNIKPINYRAAGSQPRNLFIDQFFTENIEKKDRIVYLLCAEIERYQSSITENIKTNNTKWKTYRNGIYILACIPIVFLISYLIIVIIM
jgi:hypothetical protein